MAQTQKVEIGFEGGQVVPVRIGEEALKELRSRLEHGGWYDIDTADGTLAVYLGKVAFIRIASAESRVGF